MRSGALKEQEYSDTPSIVSLDLLQGTKPRNEFRRFHLYQIRFHMLDCPVAHRRGKKINNCGVNFSRRSKRPALLSVCRNDLRNLFGELFLNAAIGFRRKLSPFRDRSRPMVGSRAVADGKTPEKSVTLSTSLPCASVMSNACTS